MGKSDLGPLEQIVLLALLRLGEDAYGVTIRDEIRQHAGRSLSPGTIYPTLERLEQKGFVSSHLGTPSPVRGGRAKRFYRLQPAGLTELRRIRRQIARLSRGFEDLLDVEG